MKSVIALLFAVACHAQTTIRPDQIRLVPSPITTPSLAVRLAAWDVSGNLTYLDIGPGVAIRNGTITAEAQYAVPVLLITRLTRAADGTYQAPAGMVARGGQIQAEGEDYTVAAGVMTPKKPWGEDEIILSISASLMVPKAEVKKP